MITQMKDSQLVIRTTQSIINKKKRLTMRENEKKRDTIQGGYTSKGMFLNIWPYNWC